MLFLTNILGNRTHFSFCNKITKTSKIVCTVPDRENDYQNNQEHANDCTPNDKPERIEFL